jgi:hypothetical protein
MLHALVAFHVHPEPAPASLNSQYAVHAAPQAAAQHTAAEHAGEVARLEASAARHKAALQAAQHAAAERAAQDASAAAVATGLTQQLGAVAAERDAAARERQELKARLAEATAARLATEARLLAAAAAGDGSGGADAVLLRMQAPTPALSQETILLASSSSDKTSPRYGQVRQQRRARSGTAWLGIAGNTYRAGQSM